MDVTDATFNAEVLDRSDEVPVVVDLWAPWCGPCRSLGPILEKVIASTEGRVALAKVNVDQNPQLAARFNARSIPAVYAIHHRQVVDGFIGALGEQAVQEFVDRLAPPDTEADQLATKGDEASLRAALELDRDHPGAILALASLLAERGEAEEALALLSRLPENATTRQLAARVRVGTGVSVGTDPAADPAADPDPDHGIPNDVEATLDDLLDRVKDDPDARRQFLDLLEVLGPDDTRTSQYRRALTARLF